MKPANELSAKGAPASPDAVAGSNGPANVTTPGQRFFLDLKDKLGEVKHKPVTPKNFRYASVNVYHDLEEEMDTMAQTREELFKNAPLGKKLMRVFRMNETWFFLLVLGFACAVVALSADTIMDWLIVGRQKMTSWEEAGFAGNYAIWVLSGVLFALLAGVCVHEVCPHSAGAGVPAMKSILSGLLLHQYLSLRCLVAKIIGIVCCYAAGLAAGKEGPYIHICGMVAYQLTKIPIFTKIRKNMGLKIQMLAAGCATGVVVTFGAPVGGVLFSIEITTTYYLTQNLWKQFFCAISAFLLVKILGNSGRVALFSTKFDPSTEGYTYSEILSFIQFGIFYGLWGALFVKVIQQLSQFRKRYKIFQVKYLQVFVVSLITCLVSFPLTPLRRGYSPIINDMFQDSPLKDWQYPNVFFNLTAFVVGQFLLTAATVGLPVPCGLYTPVFVLGASSGRLIGEILSIIFPSIGIVPASYAVLGAAALCGGVTRTIASSIIVFEVTGDMTHLLPVLMATLIATAVGNLFNLNVYDALLREKGLPYMPAIRHDKTLKEPASALMRTSVVILTAETSFAELRNILATTSFSDYPLVDNKTHKILLGQFQRTILTEMVMEHEKKFEKLLNTLSNRGQSIDEEDEEPSLDIDRNSIDVTSDVVMSTLRTGSSPGGTTAPGPPSAGGVGLRREGSRLVFDLPIKSLGSGRRKLRLSPAQAMVVQSEAQRLRNEFFNTSAELGRFVPALQAQNNQEPVVRPSTDSNESQDQQAKWKSGFDPCPFTVLESVPLSKVHFMFAVLGLSHAWVVRQGRLVGVITKKDLMQR